MYLEGQWRCSACLLSCSSWDALFLQVQPHTKAPNTSHSMFVLLMCSLVPGYRLAFRSQVCHTH